MLKGDEGDNKKSCKQEEDGIQKMSYVYNFD
jgi:hypothetical protein